MLKAVRERVDGSEPAHRSPYSPVSLVCLITVVLFLAGSLDAHDSHEIAAANITVEQLDIYDTTNSIRVKMPLSINAFHIDETSSRADLCVRIGDSATDDEQQGVLISSVAENGRNNFGTNNYPISAAYALASYGICSWVPTALKAGSAAEYNVNVSAAWFPFSNFAGGVARNSTGQNGATNDLFIASPGLVLGANLKQASNGVFFVDLKALGIDSRTDGVLLVNGAKDENNFALSQVNTNDGTWTLFLRDNAQPTYASCEQDPVSFVFIPKTNTAVVSGRFNGDASIAMFSGETPQFTVTNLGAGRWDLRIPGFRPEDGVLIISAEGGGHLNGDNIVSYAPNGAGDGWEIQSRDTPANGLQTPWGAAGEPEAVASFVFIPATHASLVSPQAGARGIGPAPRLELAVSNTVGGTVTVALYGREAPTPFPGPDFAIAVLPDTQCYSAPRSGGSKYMFASQTEWVITNREANVVYLAQLGDISDNGDIKSGAANLSEWRNITNAVYPLENRETTQLANGVPYGLAVGNHDQEPNGDPEGTSLFYNQYFGIDHFLGRSYYGGHYGTNNDNHFDLFSASGLDFIVFHFEYDTSANASVLAWAGEVLRTNANRRVIAVTHYMGSARTPSTHSAQGAAIYNALKANKNLFLLLGGHVSGEGSRQDTYLGNTVHTLISDYQSYTNGGNGFMRVMYFSPSNNVVTVQTFSPWTGQYETDEDSEFFFDYNMASEGGAGSPGTPWTLLTNATVMPNELMSYTWPGRLGTRTYEWYATVTDQSGNTAVIEPRQFTTGPNVAPFSSNVVVRVKGDQPSLIQLVATDPNLDSLTFWNNTFPAGGLIQNFDTNRGTLTYVPARGFRGFDRFTYQASDGMTSSQTATMNLFVEAPPDLDADGLPDEWESEYGVNEPDTDPDGDGQSNLAEYLANTNPTNAASVLSITGLVGETNGSFNLMWNSVGGTRYRLLYSDSLDNGLSGGFREIVRDLASEMDPGPYGAPSSRVCTDTSASTNKAGRSYRIKVVQ